MMKIMGLNKLIYVLAYEIITFVAVAWVTHWPVLAGACAFVSGFLAARDWQEWEDNENTRS